MIVVWRHHKNTVQTVLKNEKILCSTYEYVIRLVQKLLQKIDRNNCSLKKAKLILLNIF